ncbi:MAG TPA: hypothetical protein VGO47_12525 [Chlamydiales bacterium]|jgi:hypothetical protein|nr:hypothetical protein [Chlamydiales bacterium]
MTALHSVTSESQNLLGQHRENNSTPLRQTAEAITSTAIELVNRSNEQNPDSAQPLLPSKETASKPQDPVLKPEDDLEALRSSEDIIETLTAGTEEYTQTKDFEHYKEVNWSHEGGGPHKYSDSVIEPHQARTTHRTAMARYKKSEKCCIAIAVVIFLAVAATCITLKVRGDI